MKTFKTKLGTELPLMDLKGKDYLQVAHRIQWFKEEHPKGRIHTTYEIRDNKVIFCALIKDLEDNTLATAHKLDELTGVDVFEKCETGAIGRALALCGYGTQFAGMTEGDRLSDAPVDKKIFDRINKMPDLDKDYPDSYINMTQNEEYTPPFDSIPEDKNKGMKRYENKAPGNDSGLGSYTPKLGKYRGKALSTIDTFDLAGYVKWMKQQPDLKGGMLEFYDKANAYLETKEVKAAQPPKPDFAEELPF